MGSLNRYAPVPLQENPYQRRPLPMAELLGRESILHKKYDAMLLNTIGHELNHLITAYQLNVPLWGMTLTAIPEGNTLGKVTLPEHIDMSTCSVVSMAGSVPTHDGTARGYGSDVYKATILHWMGKGKSPSAARQEAAALIASYDTEVRFMCAKIIACLQMEKGMSYIPGELFIEIEKRARYEIALKNNQIGMNMPRIFNDLTPEELANKKKREDTIGRPADRRTVIEYLPGGRCRIIHTTDDRIEGAIIDACSYCFLPVPDHKYTCPMYGGKKNSETHPVRPGERHEFKGHESPFNPGFFLLPRSKLRLKH